MTRTLVGTPDPEPQRRVTPGFVVASNTVTTGSTGWATATFTFGPTTGPEYLDQALAQMADESDESPIKRVQAERLDVPPQLEP